MLVLLIGFVMWPRAIVRRQAIILGVDNYEQAGIVRDSICKQAKVNNSWMLSVEGYIKNIYHIRQELINIIIW